MDSTEIKVLQFMTVMRVFNRTLSSTIVKTVSVPNQFQYYVNFNWSIHVAADKWLNNLLL